MLDLMSLNEAGTRCHHSIVHASFSIFPSTTPNVSRIGTKIRTSPVVPAPIRRRKTCSPFQGSTSENANNSADLLDMVQLPELDDDLSSVQMEDGAWFGEDGVPASFGNDSAALRALEQEAVLVDRSRWGRLRITGSDRMSFLHGQSSADITSLRQGQGTKTVLVTPQARCIDLAQCLIQRSGVMLILSPGMDHTIKERFEKYIFPADNVSVQNVTDKTAMLSLCGPGSRSIIESMGAVELLTSEPGSHMVFGMNGDPIVVVNDGGLPGLGYTLICSRSSAAQLWSALARLGATPMGADAWEIARVVAGRPVVGKELTEDYNPFDAGLYDAVSLNKGCYIGQETLAKVYGRNAQRWELWGLHLSSPVAPGEKIFLVTGAGDNALSSPCGKVTSFVDRPILTSRGPSIEHRALGYLKRRARDGTDGSFQGATISVGGVEGTVVDIPFASRILPGECSPSQNKESVTEKSKEEDKQAEAERKAAKLAEMQAKLSAWKSQNESAS